MFIILGLVFIAIYALVVFYIGWSGWSWIKPVVSGRFRLFYIIVLIFLASSLILSRVVAGSAVLSVIGSYWLAVFSLLLMLLPLVHLMVWLTKLSSCRAAGSEVVRYPDAGYSDRPDWIWKL